MPHHACLPRCMSAFLPWVGSWQLLAHPLERQKCPVSLQSRSSGGETLTSLREGRTAGLSTQCRRIGLGKSPGSGITSPGGNKARSCTIKQLEEPSLFVRRQQTLRPFSKDSKKCLKHRYLPHHKHSTNSPQSWLLQLPVWPELSSWSASPPLPSHLWPPIASHLPKGPVHVHASAPLQRLLIPLSVP